MPHVIVEYSANVAEHHNVATLLDVIQQTFLDLDVAPVAGIRIRGVRQDEYRIADNSDPNFAYVAMVARLGPGRDAETKTRVLNAVLDATEAQFATVRSPLHIAWSFEIQEIDAAFRINRNHIKAVLDADS